jgi:hypothetical protein
MVWQICCLCCGNYVEINSKERLPYFLIWAAAKRRAERQVDRVGKRGAIEMLERVGDEHIVLDTLRLCKGSTGHLEAGVAKYMRTTSKTRCKSSTPRNGVHSHVLMNTEFVAV